MRKMFLAVLAVLFLSVSCYAKSLSSSIQLTENFDTLCSGASSYQLALSTSVFTTISSRPDRVELYVVNSATSNVYVGYTNSASTTVATNFSYETTNSFNIFAVVASTITMVPATYGTWMEKYYSGPMYLGSTTMGATVQVLEIWR